MAADHPGAFMFAFVLAFAAAQVAAAPPSEIRKTETKSVVISDVRYRGPDPHFPKPHDFEKEGVGYTRDGARLCSVAHDMEEDASAPTGLKMEAIIIKAAGIDSARDDEATVKRKAAAWLARENGRNACTGVHALFKGDASWMQAMIHPNMSGYRIVDRIILRYGLPLNDVAIRDGRTILDFLADRIDAGQSVDQHKRIYGTLRRLGARHRKELELAGELASSSQRKAANDAALLELAEAGDAKAMWALTHLYAGQGATAKAGQWLQKSISAAKAGGDSIVMSEIGVRLVDADHQAKPPFSGRRAEGVALLEAASKFNNPKETFGLMGDRSYALGWAYLTGQGVPANESVALRHLVNSGAVGIRLAAGYLLDRGRRAEAIAYLRTIRGPEWHWAFREGKTFDEWLKAQPEGICGPDLNGGDPCK
jgi:hypothetical protein